jgi:SAM-dependent methyltransferase
MSNTRWSHRLSRVLRRLYWACKDRVVIPGQFFALGRTTDQPRFALRWRDRWLCWGDATSQTGFDRHYVFHTAWACRVLAQSKPALHVDISSSLYFVSNASAFVPMEFYDYRPAHLGLDGLNCDQANLTKLHFADDSVASLSCMHVVEHVGLARYGDPLDYDGDLKAIAELRRVVAPGGQLLFVVPMGGEARIQFNAHRIYTYRQVLSMFPGFDLVEFSLIPDEGSPLGLVRHAEEELADQQRYGCGCFWLRKQT